MRFFRNFIPVSPRSCLFFISFFCIGVLMAQQDSADNLIREAAIASAIAVYHKQSADQAWRFNGTEYQFPRFKIEENGHFHFKSSNLTPGFVVYDHIRYDSLLLLYDETTEQVITRDIYNLNLVQLAASRISTFNIGQDKFIRFEKTDSNASGLQGFYQLLYEGHTTLLKKEVKQLREEVTSQGVLRFMESKISYHTLYSGRYVPIKTSRSLLNTFGSRKNDVARYMKKSKIGFKQDTENYILTAITHYDQIH
ncbi:MAG: hypothetical protein H7Y27_05150 [Gemmatimonadaceae bacterium]|nr:hypothetical protein [Chitinophagaceae bacterium]